MEHMTTSEGGLVLLGQLFNKELVAPCVTRDQIVSQLCGPGLGLEVHAMFALSQALLHRAVSPDVAVQVIASMVRVLTTSHLPAAFPHCCQALMNLGQQNPGCWTLICDALCLCTPEQLVPSLETGALCCLCLRLIAERNGLLHKLVPQLLHEVALVAQLDCYNQKNAGSRFACALMRKLSAASPATAAYLVRRKCNCLLYIFNKKSFFCFLKQLFCLGCADFHLNKRFTATSSYF